MIYADFKSILVPQDDVACIYGYKLVCINDKFSEPFKSYLGEDAVHNFISSMIDESEYRTDVMKNILTKNL